LLGKPDTAAFFEKRGGLADLLGLPARFSKINLKIFWEET